MNTKTISKINNGTFTLINKKTKTHITLKIHTVLKGKLKGKRIVSKLIGHDNTSSYQGFAFVNEKDKIVVWTRFRTDKNWKIVNILRNCVVYGKSNKYADKVEMRLSKRCMRCNRKLTSPQSLADGIGPECIKNMTF